MKILAEVIGVLKKKFNFPGELLNHLRQQIIGFTNRVAPVERLDVIKEDPDDNIVLECARTAGSDYIASFDKDLLRLGHYENALILRIADLLDILKPHKYSIPPQPHRLIS